MNMKHFSFILGLLNFISAMFCCFEKGLELIDKFVLKYFILFGSTLNETVFLNFIFKSHAFL